MFTEQEIEAAHARVKSGADFPGYVRDLSALGVSAYDIYVSDRHAVYFGGDGYEIRTGAAQTTLKIAKAGNKAALAEALKRHQAGGSDYASFCREAAEAGVAYWRVDTDALTCSYYDPEGDVLLVEAIPGN